MMTQIDFLNKIRKAYIDARDFIYKPEKNLNILTRGTSHSISSITEDLFGCYCANKVSNPDNIKIFIDPPISFKGTELKNKSGKNPLLIRPDVVLTKDNVATCFFDIKTDLGYKRKDLLNQAKERNEQLKLIKEKTATCKDGKTKTVSSLAISNKIKFIYVVISQGNIKKEVLNFFIDEIRQLENVGILLLSKGDHLNSYHDNPKWEINKNDFDELDRVLKGKLNNGK